MWRWKLLYYSIAGRTYLSLEEMMTLSMPDGPTVIIVAGQTKSPAMIHDYTISDAEQLVVKTPEVMPELTPTIEVSYDFNKNYQRDGQTLAAATAAATWDLPPVLSALGAAGAAAVFQVSNLTANAWRLSLGGAAAADREFKTTKRVPIYGM